MHKSECTRVELVICNTQRILHGHTKIQYSSKVSWQSLETRFSILKIFEDKGLSRVLRPFEKLSRAFKKISRQNCWVSSPENSFAWLNFVPFWSFLKTFPPLYFIALTLFLSWVKYLNLLHSRSQSLWHICYLHACNMPPLQNYFISVIPLWNFSLSVQRNI